MPEKQNYTIAQILSLVFGRTPRQIEKIKGQDPYNLEPINKIEGLNEQFNRIYGQLDLQFDRLSKYRDYDRMDIHSTECITGLDIYAEEASQPDSRKGLRVWVESSIPEIENELMQVLQRIKIEQKAYGMYRNLAKYGDLFEYLVLGLYGVHDILFIHPSRIERVQENGLLAYKSAALASVTALDNRLGYIAPWILVHFVVRAFDQESFYGQSFLMGLRKAYKQLNMIETVLTIYRMSKAVSRNIFQIDVGQASLQETSLLIKEYEKFLKNKVQFIDPKTNDFKLDFSPATLLQDIIWPIRPGSQTRVDKLESPMNIGPLEDVEQLKNKIRMGLNIPKDFFDGEISGAWNSKEALILQDARFGRKITRLQDAMREGLIRLFQIHWAITHREFLDPTLFQLMLGTISDSAERMREDILLRKAQILEILANLALILGWNRRVWTDYLLDEVYPLPVELRSKLNTPDPIDLENLEKEIILNTKTGSKLTKHVKPSKDPRNVSRDSIKRGLQNFGEGLEEEFPGITEQLEAELDLAIESKSPQRLVRFLNENIEEQIKRININKQRNMGMTKEEISQIIHETENNNIVSIDNKQKYLIENLVTNDKLL